MPSVALEAVSVRASVLVADVACIGASDDENKAVEVTHERVTEPSSLRPRNFVNFKSNACI